MPESNKVGELGADEKVFVVDWFGGDVDTDKFDGFFVEDGSSIEEKFSLIRGVGQILGKIETSGK